jgi:aspartate/methionine/tyrosine aminotransferase
MFRVLARVLDLEKTGRDIVHFEIGDPDFCTPPNVVEAACEAMRRGETHYTSSLGLPAFREVIREVTQHSRGFRPDLDQVLVTPGANIVIYYAVSCLVEPGEEVIIPDPGFPTYRAAIRFCGAVPVPVPLREENEFRLNPDDIRQRVTPRTRLIIINSPQNPTGSVTLPEELDAIYDIAEQADVYLLSDEVYARMVYEGTRFHSPSRRDQCRQRTLVVNGFSKAFAMTGWRLGTVLGPADVIERMGLLLQTTSSCVSQFIQYGGMEAVLGAQDAVWAMMREYRERRDLLVAGLNQLPGVRCLMPGGAFYAFPNILGTGLSDDAFAELMLQKAGVAVLPGSNFGECGRGHVRLCYATGRARIAEGLKRMQVALAR